MLTIIEGETLEKSWEISAWHMVAVYYVFTFLSLLEVSPNMSILSEFGVTKAFCGTMPLTPDVNLHRPHGSFISLRKLL